ncbi:4Fe-4S ferredoxin [Campylobacter corcagiensis]|uniref:4Fe-4S ferredoxin n=1 Tax=Campylobacter corcagiensis TaxID=1448857 RepID=A0A7M1LF20_9BACT|nr:4Fe-4S ferredoxin [Campylobacter corcagiensis]QKF64899.1 ferredoxin-type protein [Campylobacter corcagiensis]QOQ86941.1 4Fe-4S ferredoxin [Campylobacter corcagiensis]
MFFDRKIFIHPPYFSGEFSCKNCKAPCVSSCKRGLLKFEDSVIKFEVSDLGCNFCEDCALACKEIRKNTLNLEFKYTINAKALISVNSCLAWNGVICYNCQDSCRYGAIDYLGVFRPIVNDRCVGCGECLSACFKNSVSLKVKK